MVCRSDYRDSKDIRLELHQKVVGRGSSVDSELGDARSAVGFHGPDQVPRLVGDRLECRPHDVRATCASCQARQDAPSVRVPVRRAEPGERGDHVDAPGVLDGFRSVLGFGGVGDQPQVVPEPLHYGARDENRPFEREALGIRAGSGGGA